ncbi:hypothetical protein [Plantactinospora endophytica]|uniref:hypothetical protein n=1 Tax=Plantactinospora endophytica TaxID=673535 RepID=UPI001EF389A4|nr:hypothetical protein [Plantactinospora endophytica]
MPDDDRSETAYSAVPSTVRSDDASSSDSVTGRSGTPAPRPGPLGPAGLRRLVLVLVALLGRARRVGPAVLRRLDRAVTAVARLARPGVTAAGRFARPVATAAGRLGRVGVARLRAAAGPALTVLRAQAPRLHRAVAPGLVLARRMPAFRAAERALGRAARWGVPRARRLAVRAGALAVRTGLPDRLGLRRPAGVAVAAGVLCCLGVLAVVQAAPRSADPAGTSPANAGDRVALARPDDGTGEPADAARPADRSSRSGGHDRSDSGESKAADSDASALTDSAPVAGLTDVQMDNARAIVRTGRDMGVSRRGLIIGVATAMQESNLLNRASEVLPESKRYRHQGTGWDHDSVGLFQQRTSSGWGPVNRLMDPAYASARFFEALRQVPGWERMRLTEAAQAVQYSAYPEHYAKHEGGATRVVDALVPSWH